MELPNLKIGPTGSAEITVQDADTAPRIGSGRVSVLATPVMINLMEAAALNAVERLLPHGHQSPRHAAGGWALRRDARGHAPARHR